MTQRHTIVRGGRITNLGSSGRPAYHRTRGLIQYIGYGRYADSLGQEQELRGSWQDHHGRERSHESVLSWAKERVHRHRYEYTYQLLLSTRDGQLQAQDFNHVLQQGSELSQVNEWRMMLHDDTDHQHAHVILFRKQALSQAQYKQWQQTMQHALDQVQGQRQEQQLAQQLEVVQQQDGGQSL